MNNYLWIGAVSLFLIGSACHGGGKTHDHDAHHATELPSHDDHDHDGHDHDNHHHEGHDHDGHGHEAQAPSSHSDEILLPPDKAQAAGVRITTVAPGPFRQVIPAGGQLLSAQGEEATVVASMTGTVHLLHPLTPGTAIGKATRCLQIASDKLQDGNTVERTRIAYETAKAAYERGARLATDQIVSQKELARRKATYVRAPTAYEALSPTADGKAATVTSPIGGYVKNCYVQEGDYVTVGQPLMSVTQNRRLQLRAELSERHYAQLRDIRSAHFKTPYETRVYALEELKGRLLSVGKSTADGAFYVPVTFEFDNCGDLLPGAFVEVWLLGSERQDIISLPVTALTEEQGVHFVYLQVDEEGYRKQEVKTGDTDGCRVEILAGVKAGDRVVTEGAIHVKLAGAGNALPAHSHQH